VLHQRGPGQSPGGKHIFDIHVFLSLGNASGGNNFGSYFTSHYPCENDDVHVK